jgi:hypothetical protein
MGSLYRGPSIDASYQVSVHLAKWFQRRRLKSASVLKCDLYPLTTHLKDISTFLAHFANAM